MGFLYRGHGILEECLFSRIQKFNSEKVLVSFISNFASIFKRVIIFFE